MRGPEYQGVLFIGDPHLASRIPGFRRDDYPRTVLAKLAFCLERAREERLLPAILGDLFDLPRENANWLLGELLALLSGREVLAIHGNHDCRENDLCSDDSLSVLVKAGSLRLVDQEQPWRGQIGGRDVIIGGTSWGRRLPDSVPPEAGSSSPLVLWMAHHDVKVPGYEEQGRIRPREIAGVDLLVNGHIHRRLEDVRKGRTLWVTPGAISRIARSDATRDHVPAALAVEIDGEGFRRRLISFPYRPFEEVFHPEVAGECPAGQSAFVQGLAELEARRTASGAGLLAFLEVNLEQFENAVGEEVLSLAREVTAHGGS